jgi:hypothetical protein
MRANLIPQRHCVACIYLHENHSFYLPMRSKTLSSDREQNLRSLREENVDQRSSDGNEPAMGLVRTISLQF